MRLQNFTILYVEDELTTQELIGEILRDSCKEVFIANDGEEGLKLYKEKKPDIILSDIAMPNMNGLEMSEAIKAIDSEQAIALFTAFSQSSYLKKAAELGIATYILKPLDEDQFFNSLNYMALELEMSREEEEKE
ncbi:MAG: Diguanylate cyclase/phosphodiesterase (GGDEF & EAL domains) with PAS/PAC sensor(S) [uncultured Sulfurovum sp.]|uniref:Diguanylate cyclase/phosphodiesterase (GGDEF & EAL domains) with PAS/PAC sensor(S) n=1 Tax=uncultured Sulfurovum sp. TaxID=269237 RepID=A0A6S6SY13_9BACT|nr:MAG: Diguanylate cyclase/phosphodiesterase (GGDEF & EAL domains) with PAS/PAC sensor(S) [uncultured Sulfurovum sp.]